MAISGVIIVLPCSSFYIDNKLIFKCCSIFNNALTIFKLCSLIVKNACFMHTRPWVQWELILQKNWLSELTQVKMWRAVSLLVQ